MFVRLLLTIVLVTIFVFNKVWVCGSIFGHHPLLSEFDNYLELCAKDDVACEDQSKNISILCLRIANEHAQLLLHDVTKQVFQDAYFVLRPNSTVGKLIARIISVHEFSQGNLLLVKLISLFSP